MNWQLEYWRNTFRKNWKMNLFSSLAIFLSLLSTIFLTTVIDNLQVISQSNYRNYLHAAKLKLEKKEQTMIEGTSLSLVKTSRPEINEMVSIKKHLPFLRYENNLSAFFNEYPYIKSQNLQQKIQCVSLTNLSLNQQIIGSYPQEMSSFSEVYLNQEAAKLLDIEVGEEFYILWRAENVVTYGLERMIVNFAYDLKTRVIGIVEEFSFLNEPRIYYSYEHSRDFLKNNYCLEIYAQHFTKISYLDLIKNADGADAMSAYSYYLFANSIFEVEQIFEFFKQENLLQKYEITNHAMQIKETLLSSSLAFKLTSEIFMTIFLLISGTILVFASLYNFERSKKNITILATLGSSRFSLFSLNIIPNCLLTFSASVIAFLLLSLFINPLNMILFILFEVYDLLPFIIVLKTTIFYSFLAIVLTILMSFGFLVYKFSQFDLSTALKEE